MINDLEELFITTLIYSTLLLSMNYNPLMMAASM
jgi:hypothetical protein